MRLQRGRPEIDTTCFRPASRRGRMDGTADPLEGALRSRTMRLALLLAGLLAALSFALPFPSLAASVRPQQQQLSYDRIGHELAFKPAVPGVPPPAEPDIIPSSFAA